MSARSAQYAPCHVVAQKGPAAYRSKFFGSDPAPSHQAFGCGLQDHRFPWDMYQGQSPSIGYGVLGWFGTEPICLSLAPSVIVVGGICAAANVTNLTPMTLAGASTGITVASALTLFPGFIVNGQAPISAGLVLDGVPTPLSFGRRFLSAFYDRSKMLSRAVSITGSASATGGHFIVSGFDVYGFPMTENINATSGAATTNGKKAFKVVTSVVPQFTDAHNYSCQTTDIYGLPLLTLRFEDTGVFWNGSWVSATTGFVAADTTTPATSTTGDPRGTYAVQSASDGTKFLSVEITPSVASMASNQPTSLTTGLFGVTPA